MNISSTFERIYVPHCRQEKDRTERLIKVALENGFKCSENIGNTREEQIQGLNKENHFLVLEKFNDCLTITPKPNVQVFPHIGDKGVELYSPERAIKWIIEKHLKTK